MTDMTQTHRDAVLNVLRSTTLTGFAAYVGLITTGTTEMTGGGYARQAAGFGAPTTDGGYRRIENASTLTFGPASGSPWAEATRFGVYDAVSAGNLLYADDLAAPRTAGVGDTIQFAAGACAVRQQ